MAGRIVLPAPELHLAPPPRARAREGVLLDVKRTGRRMRIAGFAVVCCSAALFTFARDAQGAEAPKSPAVHEAKAKYDAAVKEAEAAIAAAKAAYLEQLDAGVKAALKAEDLEEANRIDAIRKALRA